MSERWRVHKSRTFKGEWVAVAPRGIVRYIYQNSWREAYDYADKQARTTTNGDA